MEKKKKKFTIKINIYFSNKEMQFYLNNSFVLYIIDATSI